MHFYGISEVPIYSEQRKFLPNPKMTQCDRLTSVCSNKSTEADKTTFADWSDGLDDADDSDLYFSPDRQAFTFVHFS